MRVAVCAGAPEFATAAERLATELDIPLGTLSTRDCEALLVLDEQGLGIKPVGERMHPVRVDFGAPAMRHRRRGGQNELLGRAVGVGKRDALSVIDATAGLGRDAFVLADLGCTVSMVEQSPLVHALLRDGLERALGSADPWLQQVCERLELCCADSVTALSQRSADVVYLDPMFPERGKSARAKKDMWLFQALPHTDTQAEPLLQAALAAASFRVVLKRPLKAPQLGDVAPGFSLRGRAVRYDVYPRS